ncbi:metal ABC transporter permease [Corynebacterium auris]|uniref:metal ABC transporter permease n=1 Tax=Corynebacterium auris TaxID=44750 RepID=UPI0025B3B055|nr:iron chelate uptake ABC transporter family permease subunit [Corynebacterium auris]WJY68656.1 High-affinity zinc uptake system membrane protein ZnuB [Corynebacterium auris]
MVTPYLLRPLIMLVALGACAGAVGTLVNLRRAEFSAEAISHAVFPGIVVGFIVAGLDGIVPGGAVVGAVAAAVLTVLARRGGALEEAGTAIVLASFYAAGMVISLAHSDKSGQLEALMFGRLLELTDARFTHALIACAVALALVWSAWPRQVAVAFDRTAARAAGIKVGRQDALLNAAVAATVVAGASAVGVLLVVGFVVIPAAAARLVTPSTEAMAVMASTFGVSAGVAGMWVVAQPIARPVSPQACVVMVLLGGFLLVAALRGGARWVTRQPAR